MSDHHAVGIDVGTHTVRVVVAREDPQNPGHPTIIGTGQSESKGLRYGYIMNIDDVARCIAAAVIQAQQVSGVRIREAFVSIGGIGLDEVHARGEAVIARADAEVTDLDIARCLESSRESAGGRLANRRILHTVPLRYCIDGVEVLGRPHSMKGTKLTVDVRYVTCIEQHVQDLIEAVELAGIAVLDTLAAPLAASIVTLTNSEKKAGCVLVNIGSETLSTLVFDNSVPLSLKVFKIGSMDITKDLALGLRLSLEDAEQLKVGTPATHNIPKKKIDDILAARLSDMFELVESHLKKIGKDQLLPAGIILTGGGSGSGPIKEIAEQSLRLHSKIASLNMPADTHIKDSSWSTAYGLTVWGFTGSDLSHNSGFGDTVREWVGKGSDFIKQFLP